MDQHHNESPQSPTGHLISPGARLRHAREALALTIDDIANFLHLRPQLIEEIEVDDYRSIRQRVFLIGYLRSYAKRVNLVSDEIIHLFKEVCADPVVAPYPAPVMRNPQFHGPKKSSMPRLANYVIIFGGVVLMAIWWHNLKSAHHDSQREMTQAAKVAVVAPAVAPVKPAEVANANTLSAVAVNDAQAPAQPASSDQGKVARDFDLPSQQPVQRHNVPWTELQ